MPPRANKSKRRRHQGGGRQETSNIRSRVYLSVCMEGSRLGIALLDLNSGSQDTVVQASELDDALAAMLRGVVSYSIDARHDDGGNDDDVLGCLVLYPGKSPLVLRQQLGDIVQTSGTARQPQMADGGDAGLVDPIILSTTMTAIERPVSQYEYPSCVQRVLELMAKLQSADDAATNNTSTSLPITGGHSQLWRALSGLLSFLDEMGLLTRYRPRAVVMKPLEGLLSVDSVTLRTLGVTSAGRSTAIVAGHNHRVMTPSITRLLGRYISSPPGRGVLQRWLAMPCSNIDIIESRLKAQEIIIGNLSPDLASRMSKNLRKHRDLSKILDRVTQGFNLDSAARVAAWLQLLRSCQAALEIIRSIEMLPPTSPLRIEVPCISSLLECRTPLLQIQHMLEASFDLDAWAAAGPTHLSIKVGIIPELDALREQYDKLEDILTRMGAAESKALEDRLQQQQGGGAGSLPSCSLAPSNIDYHGNDPNDPWYEALSTTGCDHHSDHRPIAGSYISDSQLFSRPVHIQLQYFPQMGFVASLPSADVQEVLVPLLSAGRGKLRDIDDDWQECVDVVCGNLEGWDFKFRTADRAFFKSPITRRLDKYLGNIESKMIEIEYYHPLPLIRVYGCRYEYLYRLADRLEEIGSKPLAVATAALSELDCLLGLSRASREHGWTRPTVVPPCTNDRGEVVMKLTGSWHPLMSDATTTTATSGGRIDNSHSVVSNDILITSDCRTHILTGPNYSGKSVLLKQIGLTAFLCHCGVYVPAKQCRMQLLTQLFARMASSDQRIPKFVSAGERRQLEDIVRSSTLLSTFTRDAHEVSVALANCSRTSLILLDEFGKGTSPIDEVSLLSGIVKYASIDLNINAPTLLLTTHYATELYTWGLIKTPQQCVDDGDQQMKRQRKHAVGKALPCRLAVVPPKDRGASVVYLYKLERNRYSQASYPIQCAVASGVCSSVTDRAAEVLESIRSGKPLAKPRDPDEGTHQPKPHDMTADRGSSDTLTHILLTFSQLDLSSGLNQGNRAALQSILRQLRPGATAEPRLALSRPDAIRSDIVLPPGNRLRLGVEGSHPHERTDKMPSSIEGWSVLIDEDLFTTRQGIIGNGGS